MAAGDQNEVTRDMLSQLIDTKQYKNSDEIQRQILNFVEKYPEFRPQNADFVFESKKSQRFLQIKGHLSIKQKGGLYDIVLIVWFSVHYPVSPPMVYIQPVHSSQNLRSGRFVQPNGRVTHPYLKSWKTVVDLSVVWRLRESVSSSPDRCEQTNPNLCEFVEVLQHDLMTDPPVYNTQATFYYQPEDINPRIKPRVESRVPSVTPSLTGQLPSDMTEFGREFDLPMELVCWLVEEGFTTRESLRCLKEKDIENTGLLMGHRVLLREAITELKGLAGVTSSDSDKRDSSFHDTLCGAVYGILDNMRIPTKCLEIRRSLGDGNFGVVKLATLRMEDQEPKTVAIKTLSPYAKQQEKEAFVVEVINMRTLSHPNVMTLLGFAELDDNPYIVMPYMEKADLKKYVSNPENIITVHLAINFAAQTAAGMAYLAAHKFIHGDLAARNCLLSDDLVVKVGDFGLARHLVLSEYYMSSDTKPCPYRWIAPEVVELKAYTLSSDVWSFGVLFWELLTRGKTPYEDHPAIAVLSKITQGHRLPRPASADKALYRVMEQCWHLNDADRPSFADLERWLLKMQNSYHGQEIALDPSSRLEPLPPKRKTHPLSRVTTLYPHGHEPQESKLAKRKTAFT